LKGEVMNSRISIEFSQRTDGAVKMASNPLLKPEWGAHIVRVLIPFFSLTPRTTLPLPTEESARNARKLCRLTQLIQASSSKA
jgi:hypothetical protein